MEETGFIDTLPIYGEKFLQYVQTNQTYIFLYAFGIIILLVIFYVVKSNLNATINKNLKIVRDLVTKVEKVEPPPVLATTQTEQHPAFGPTETEVMREEEAERRRPPLPPQHTPEPNKWKLVTLISSAKQPKAA